MENFAFFTYTFEEKRRLRSEETGETSLEMSAQIFENILRMNNELFLKKNGETLRLTYKESIGRDHVFVYELCNQIQKIVKDGHDDVPVESRPGSYILIDNREGMFQIGIEANVAFGNSKTGFLRVAEMLKEMFDSNLSVDGLSISIRALYETKPFLARVADFRKKNPTDSISSVHFSFPRFSKEKGATMNDHESKMMEAMQRALDFDDAVETRLECIYGTEQAPDLEKGKLGMLVDLCTRNSYTMSVSFRSGKTFCTSTGKSVKRVVEKKYIQLFLDGQTCMADNSAVPTYDLCIKLTMIKDELKECTGGQIVEA